MRTLGNNEIQHMAPSVFTQAKHDRTSDKYQAIPTIEVVDLMRKEGWMPVQASEQAVRLDGRRGFQKHMIRFRRDSVDVMQVGGSVPEIVLTNSHDGTSAYRVDAGLFKLVCSNGLVIADSLFDAIRIRHMGFDPSQVIDATYSVMERIPVIADSVEAMRAVTLTEGEQRAFAKAAVALKYDDEKNPAPFSDASKILTPRRWEDAKNDLWSTFNRAQENLIRGGIRGRTANGRRTSTRAVNSLTENVRLNKSLWMLAEEMKNLKS